MIYKYILKTTIREIRIPTYYVTWNYTCKMQIIYLKKIKSKHFKIVKIFFEIFYKNI